MDSWKPRIKSSQQQIYKILFTPRLWRLLPSQQLRFVADQSTQILSSPENLHGKELVHSITNTRYEIQYPSRLLCQPCWSLRCGRGYSWHRLSRYYRKVLSERATSWTLPRGWHHRKTSNSAHGHWCSWHWFGSTSGRLCLQRHKLFRSMRVHPVVYRSMW